jgi:hypothetical protein
MIGTEQPGRPFAYQLICQDVLPFVLPVARVSKQAVFITPALEGQTTSCRVYTCGISQQGNYGRLATPSWPMLHEDEKSETKGREPSCAPERLCLRENLWCAGCTAA